MSGNIFHEYDIRGRYPGEVNEAVFYKLGEAYSHTFKPKKIAIGRDARLSSGTLFLYLASALQNHKVKIVDLGLISTPFCLWYSQKYKIDTLMITASHNPKDQNGLKVFSAKKGIIDKNSGLSRLEAKFKSSTSSLAKAEVKSASWRNAKTYSPVGEYVDFLIKKIPMPKTKLKIALDFSNGSAGKEFVLALEKLKIDFATLNEVPNGKFPAHSPNPLLSESQKGLKILIKQGRFNLGAVVDGDGDRILFLDEQGEAVDPAYIFSLIIKFYLVPQKAKIVAKNIALARIVDETTASAGLKLKTVPVGRTKMQATMKKLKAEMGVEKSGHYFFKDLYYGDNGLAALLVLISVLAKNKKPLSKLLEPYRNYIIIPEINIPFEGRVDQILGTIKERYKNQTITELDGLSVENPAWRFNLRRSNTESVWRLNLEGRDKNQLEDLRQEIEKILS